MGLGKKDPNRKYSRLLDWGFHVLITMHYFYQQKDMFSLLTLKPTD